jgi:hypothetical protein
MANENTYIYCFLYPIKMIEELKKKKIPKGKENRGEIIAIIEILDEETDGQLPSELA